MELNNLLLDSICCVRGDVSKLSVQEKQWLGTEVLEGRATITTLARRVGLPNRAVKRYAHKVRHQCIFLGKPGRRRLLDGSYVLLITSIKSNKMVLSYQLKKVAGGDRDIQKAR